MRLIIARQQRFNDRQTNFMKCIPFACPSVAMRKDGRQTDELVSREFNEVNDRQMNLMKNVFHSPVRRQHLAVLSRLFNGGSGEAVISFSLDFAKTVGGDIIS